MKVLKIIFGIFVLLGLSLPCLAEVGPRWNKNLVMVYIPSESQYAPAMQKAFKEWQGKLPSKLQFFVTSSERDRRLVEIDVSFNKLEGEKDVNSGLTTLDGTAYYRHGSIVINAVAREDIEKDPKKKAKNDEEIYQVMLREVGKVIGLSNSSNEKSVMYSKVLEGQTILPEDINNVCEKYGWTYRQ